MDLGLAGKSVLITGGSKGIGLAAAKSFAAEGCSVHIVARSAEALASAREEILATRPVDVHCHAVDLRDSAQLLDLARRCEGVDILINNAGDIPGGTIETLDDAAWRHAWELKVFGYVNLTREIFTRMKARKSGTIVNVMGMAAQNPSFEYVCGATANAGLISDIISCPGMDYCSLATARSIPVAQRISERFADGPRAREIGAMKIKISGCINACGHHHVGHIGILGLERKGVETYQLTLGGSGDERCTLGDITGPGFSYEDVVDAVETVVDAYVGLRASPDEDFLSAYRRVGMAPFKRALYERDSGSDI
jgi:dissimilatory sulfite reductase (desulfoviridin) alpha/beta subunit